MNRSAKILITLVIVIIGVISSAALYVSLRSKRTAYVDNVYVFDKSKMKLDLYKKLEHDQKLREDGLDTLKQKIIAVEKQLTGNPKDQELIGKYRMLQELFLDKKQKFSEELAFLNRDYDNKIWQHINEKIAQYGKDKGYTYIFGANGQGSLMYANETEAVTEEVLNFINNDYEDIK